MSSKTEPEATMLSKKFNWRISEPKDFSGVSVPGEDLGNEAFAWLKKMERLKNSAKLSDEEVLFLVGDHLTKKAETWFNVIGNKASTWTSFITMFKKQYLVDQEDKWWWQLQNMKQREDDTIDDVALKMEELFELLENKSEGFQVRTFLSAIRPDIGFEVEKEGTPINFQDAKSKAKQIEKSLRKYESNRKIGGSPTYVDKPIEFKTGSYERRSNSGYSDTSSVVGSEVSSLVAKLEQLSINLVKLNEGVMNRQPMQRVQYNNPSPVSGNRVFTCFYCRDEGHKKYDCPKFIRDQNQASSPATGSNNIPLGAVSSQESGKGNEHQ